MSLRRRDLFRIGGVGGGIGLIGAAGWSVARMLGAKDNREALPPLDIDCTGEPYAASGAGYAAKFAPAAYLAGDRDSFHVPPLRTPFSPEIREYDLSVVESTLEVAA